MIGIYCSNFSSPKSSKSPSLNFAETKCFAESQTQILKTFVNPENPQTGVILFGELFSLDGIAISDHSDAEKLFNHLNSDKNIDSANGLFVSIYFNEQSINVSNDRFGTYPVYIFQDGKHFIVSTDLKEIIESEKVELDDNCINEYLVLGFLLQPKSAFKNIRRLLPGSTISITLNNMNLTEKTYYNPAFHIDNSISIKDFSHEFNLAIQRSYLKKTDILSAALTGGWDTRLTWSYLLKNEAKDISSFTHGVERSNDIQFSRKITRNFDISRKEVLFDPSEIIKFSLKPNYFLHGFQDFTNLHLAFSYEKQKQLHTCVIDSSGFDFRSGFLGKISSDISLKSFIDILFASTSVSQTNFNQKSLSMFESVKNELSNEVESLQEYSKNCEQIRDLFYLKHKLISNSTTTFQVNHVIARMPFLDYNLVDMGLRLNTDSRRNQQLFINLIKMNKPELLKFPLDHAGEKSVVTSNKWVKYSYILSQRVFNKLIGRNKNDFYLINHDSTIQSVLELNLFNQNLDNLKEKYSSGKTPDHTLLLRLCNVAATQYFLNTKN